MNVSLHTELIIILCYTVNDVACEIPAKKIFPMIPSEKRNTWQRKKSKSKKLRFYIFRKFTFEKKNRLF